MFLLIAISLREFKVEYIEHHPMVNELANVKEYLLKVIVRAGKLQKSYVPQKSLRYEELKKKQIKEKL